MAQLETLGILEEIESLVSDQLQVVTKPLSLSIQRNLSPDHQFHASNFRYLSVILIYYERITSMHGH